MNEGKLKTLIAKAPAEPGIYIFTGIEGEKLYIGKASNIKTRLSSYLKTTDHRIRQMVLRAKNIQTLKTNSEIEALILESQYIKRHKPAFNIMLRDDKNFFYVGFTKEDWPKIFITHQPTKIRNSNIEIRNKFKIQNLKFKTVSDLGFRASDFHSANDEWLGPFTDGTALKTTLRYLRRVFPYCTCKKPHNNFCLNYHIGKCLGFCCLKNLSMDKFLRQQKEYQKNTSSIKDILSGKKNYLLKNLEKEMVALGKKEEFVKAIELRNRIEKIKRVFENAEIIKNQNFPHYDISKNHNEIALTELKKFLSLKNMPARIEGYDIANIQGKYAVGAMAVFKNGKPSKNEYRKFKIYTKNTADDTAMLKEVLKRRSHHPEWPMPDTILIDGGKAQLNAAHSVISTEIPGFAREPSPRNFKFLISKQSQNSKFKIPIIALTKDKKHRGHKIYIAGKTTPVPLSKLPADIKNLLLHVNAEAHRFAISYYRHRHRKALS